MTSIKIPNPGVDKPYGPVSGGKNLATGPMVVYGFGGQTNVYGPAAKPDSKATHIPNSIPSGTTRRKLSQR